MQATTQTLKRKITAIMAADIAEYARIVAEDEEEALKRLESYRHVFDDFVVRAGGRVFNTGGDSVMCEFPSAVEATRCAIDIQESLRTRNRDYPLSRQMHFRIGISIGDVVERAGDLLGDSVNIAARLQTLAEPGSICVARNVQEAVANKISLPFRDLGYREVKNLPHPVHAFQIDLGAGKGRANTDSGPDYRPVARQGAAHARVPLAAIWLAAIIAIAAGGAGLYFQGRTDATPAPAVATVPAQPDAPSAVRSRPAVSIVVTENLTPAQAFERLARSGGLVKEAATAPELYHNARIYEARGEGANARRDYLALASLGSDYIDPLLRLAALVRAQDGRAGAREVFANHVVGRARAVSLVHILQFEGAERMAKLTAFAEANPEFAPVHALLAFELGDDQQNIQTIDEKRRELRSLASFLAAEREGRLVPYFLDHSVLAQWIDRAQKRDATQRAFFAGGKDRIAAKFMQANAAWTGIVSLPEPAIQLEVRVGLNGEFRATGVLPTIDSRTGKPLPNPSFQLPPQQTATEIFLRYLDAKGLQSPVTNVAFSPRAALVESLRDALEGTTGSWLTFGSGQNSNTLFFTHLASYRCAIEKVEIGFNGEAPTQVLALPPCDPANPRNVSDALRSSIRLSPGTESASVRLTYVGGDRSEVKVFPNPR